MKGFVFGLIFFLCAVWVQAEMQLSSLFSDGMVLQQKQAIPVWGWGKSGASVRVEFKGQAKSTTVGADGKWMVRLDPVEASAKPAVLKITVGSETREIKDVLVGEVWICAGQSNMDFQLRKMIERRLRTPKNKPIVEFMKKELASANDPLLRQIVVPHKISVDKELNQFKGSWVASSNPKNAGDFSATAYFFGRKLRKELGVPVGLIKCPWGGTQVEPWLPMSTYQTTDSLKAYYTKKRAKADKAYAAWQSDEHAEKVYQEQLKAWEKKNAEKKKGKLRKPRKMQNPYTNKAYRQYPSALYNAMIAPLVPYAIRGVIWYQGESNASYYADKYEERFSAMIKGWRKVWNQGDFPFYYAQLASYKAPHKNPIQKKGWVNNWITICDHQRRTLKLKNTGMAVLNDIGEAHDIHPKNKVDAGERLARWALAKDYGKDIVPSGPLFKSCVRKGASIVVSFDYAPHGLMVAKKEGLKPATPVKEPLFGFQLCGKDGVWKWADAKIISTNSVEVSSKEVPDPVSVRYAWDCNPEGCNLYNKEGLPTSVFVATP